MSTRLATFTGILRKNDEKRWLYSLLLSYMLICLFLAKGVVSKNAPKRQASHATLFVLNFLPFNTSKVSEFMIQFQIRNYSLNLPFGLLVLNEDAPLLIVCTMLYSVHVCST